jgi:type 1 fimbriae regulatory protein FimB/type 1 fimbriae regulatory protein FimE
MMRAAKTGRWGHRDALLILMGYRHGLRISELVNLRWQQVDFKSGHLHVRRVKGSRPATHPIAGTELRSLGNCCEKILNLHIYLILSVAVR